MTINKNGVFIGGKVVNSVIANGDNNVVHSRNGKIKVNGVEVEHDATDNILSIIIEDGIPVKIQADGHVTANNVSGNVSSFGHVTVNDVQGNIQAGGNVSVEGYVIGSIEAGGSVKVYNQEGKA